MKKLLVLLFSIFLHSSVYASDVYYCSDDNHIGYKVKENFAVKNFTTKKFKIKIDFKNLDVESDKIFMTILKECVFNTYTNSLMCISKYGTTFAINKDTLRFARSEMYTQKIPNDDYTLAYGTCEKF
jgi:hypothetical protein